MFPMNPVESSRLKAIGHDGKDTLRIQFPTGATYEYTGVSNDLYKQLSEPEDGSVGKAFNKLILSNKEIPFKKLPAEDETAA